MPWLNVVCCFPNRTPTAREVEACKENLYAQLQVIQPRLLLLFGGVAASAFVDGYRVGELRGRWVKCPIPDLHEVWGLVTWHPAAVLRNPSLHLDVLDDLRVFRESMGENGIPPYVYRPCVKCGSCVGTYVTDDGIAWCEKHWAWKLGTTGRGRKRGQGKLL